MLTLRNDIHGTAIRTMAQPGTRVSADIVRRWKGALCGTGDCECSEHGLHGRNPFTIEPADDENGKITHYDLV